ncbi:MAG: AAA family ATPase [Saprospiraceae bacterium]|jgi:exonuclease SbcC|nr:AAA family ATPase [Saprospiraceae bacterium]
MKIIKLRFKNIHSFKGSHEVDFTQPPLSNSGLFAITGSTGAGKSTILDVITLALFNQIPRFDSKITNTEIETLGSVMTHFSDDAYAEVEYQTGNDTYRSTWKISKTRNNTLREYEMFLANIQDEKYLDLKKSEVPKKNEEIIGLNYDQFIRSIILSQGEFAKFLKADKAERTFLLEEITGSKIYRALGKAAYEKAKIKREEINQLKIRKDAIPILSDEQISIKSALIVTNTSMIKKTDLEILSCKNTLSLLEKKLQISQKRIDVEGAMTLLRQRISDFEMQETLLKKHQNLDIFRSELTLWKHEDQLASDSQKEIENCKTAVGTQEKLLGEAIQKMMVFTKEDINEEKFLSEMKKFENKIIRLDGELMLLKEKGTLARAELNEILNNPNYAKYAGPIQHLKQINEQWELCRNQLSNVVNRKPFSENDEQLRLKIRSLTEELSRQESKFVAVKAYYLAMEESNILLKSKAKFADLQHSLAIEIERLNTDINILVPDIASLQKKKEEQFKVAALDEQRKLLKDDEPCPLCGSIHHPYAEDQVYSDLGKTEASILVLQQQLDTCRNELLKHTAELSSVISNMGSAEKEMEYKSSVISKILQEYPDFAKSENISDTIGNSISLLKMEINAVESEIEARAAFNFYAQCDTKLETLNDASKKFIELHQQRNSLYQGSDINGDADAIQNEYISARDISKEWKSTLQNLQKSYNLHQETQQIREKQLLIDLSSLGYHDVRSALNDILSDQTFRQIIFEKEKITKEETELNSTLLNLKMEYDELKMPEDVENNIPELKSKIDLMQAEKDQIIHSNGALTNELENDVKSKSLISEVEDLLTEKNKDAEVWYILDKLIGDATGTKYARFAQNLSLKHLIDLANRRLVKLTDRYQLVYTDIESDLTISDLYQGNIRRSVKTLSGGESFIVSLALALSLADMASQNVRLDSLFIDEGFGTLDAETLETAIGTLETLQSESDRTIGIISHVESLKERISTQIKVIKNTSGYAEIEVVG